MFLWEDVHAVRDVTHVGIVFVVSVPLHGLVSFPHEKTTNLQLVSRLSHVSLTSGSAAASKHQSNQTLILSTPPPGKSCCSCSNRQSLVIGLNALACSETVTYSHSNADRNGCM